MSIMTFNSDSTTVHSFVGSDHRIYNVAVDRITGQIEVTRCFRGHSESGITITQAKSMCPDQNYNFVLHPWPPGTQ
jgi:hypothetical protein